VKQTTEDQQGEYDQDHQRAKHTQGRLLIKINHQDQRKKD